MISAVDICNIALNHIGIRPITSLTESSNEARKCNLVYTFARDSVLRAHDWNFSTKIETLALISDETILGWDYLYARPTNCLYIRKIYNEGNVSSSLSTEFKEFKTSNNQKAIACNIEDAYIEYTQIVTDTNDFDSNFVEALTFRLASLIAKQLTGDATLAEKMEKNYSGLISDAKRVNSSERNTRGEQYNEYLEAR